MSADGAFDMVGNVGEWVADWVPRSVLQGGILYAWGAGVSPTGDFQQLVGAALTGEPGALLRGGWYSPSGPASGPLAVSGYNSPSSANGVFGFRCGAR